MLTGCRTRKNVSQENQDKLWGGQEISKAYIIASHEYQNHEKQHDEGTKSIHFIKSSEVLSKST